MAHDRKRGFLSSLFGRKKQTEEQELAELEAKHRLEERIRQVLEERTEAPKLLTVEEHQAALMIREEETPASEVNLLPISASVPQGRKAPVSTPFLLAAFEVPQRRSYAANER